MKKVLLSLSMLAAVMTASAQVTLVPIYGGNPLNAADSVNAETGWSNFDGAVPTGFAATEVTETGGNIYLKVVGASAGYYVWGVNNGKYNAAGDEAGLPFGYTGAATGYVSFRAKAGNANSRVKIGLQTTDDKTFAAEIDLGAVPANLTAFRVQNLAFNTMRQEDENGAQVGATPTYPTATDLANVSKINVILQVNSCSWNGSDCDLVSRDGEIWIDDIYMSQNSLTTITPIPLSTASAAANIASTKVFPNPASGAFTAEIVLKNNANVTVILSDMMGKQLSTKTVANGSASFETAGLANGMYTVTYVVDGTPAKTELVVVK